MRIKKKVEVEIEITYPNYIDEIKKQICCSQYCKFIDECHKFCHLFGKQINANFDYYRCPACLKTFGRG